MIILTNMTSSRLNDEIYNITYDNKKYFEKYSNVEKKILSESKVVDELQTKKRLMYLKMGVHQTTTS